MKNSDMPAMPLSGDAYNDFAGYVPGKTSFNPECQGLTKREMFAMHAMQGLLSNATLGQLMQQMAVDNRVSVQDAVVSSSVKMADALLAELEKKQ